MWLINLKTASSTLWVKFVSLFVAAIGPGSVGALILSLTLLGGAIIIVLFGFAHALGFPALLTLYLTQAFDLSMGSTPGSGSVFSWMLTVPLFISIRFFSTQGIFNFPTMDSVALQESAIQAYLLNLAPSQILIWCAISFVMFLICVLSAKILLHYGLSFKKQIANNGQHWVESGEQNLQELKAKLIAQKEQSILGTIVQNSTSERSDSAPPNSKGGRL